MLPQGSGKLVSGAISVKFPRSCYTLTVHSVKTVTEKHLMGLEKGKSHLVQSHSNVFLACHLDNRDEAKEDNSNNLKLKDKTHTCCRNRKAIQ